MRVGDKVLVNYQDGPYHHMVGTVTAIDTPGSAPDERVEVKIPGEVFMVCFAEEDLEVL